MTACGIRLHGVEEDDARFPDFAGRPVPILPSGEPIEELLG